MKPLPSLQGILTLFLALFLLFNIPKNNVCFLKTKTYAFFSPYWNFLSTIKTSPSLIYFQYRLWKEDLLLQEEKEKLSLENQQLKEENRLLKEEYEMMHQVKNIFPSCVHAKVIFRSFFSWNHSFWINVGYDDDPSIIAKNSPVLSGTSLIGVIDYVAEHQSLVRLITDPGLCPSVRAKRVLYGKPHYLAKGILQGIHLAHARKNLPLLRGTGFNYDFADEIGSSHSLQSNEMDNARKNPILLKGDLLVTTGMDGIFPPNIEVATVEKVETLKEGDYYYDILAKPCYKNIDDVRCVLILPPQDFDFSKKPPLLGCFDDFFR